MLPIKNIEDYVRIETRGADSIIHDFSHLKRTADGAVWFVRMLGGTKEEEELAYIAGLLHDIVRPVSEKICHAEASAKRSTQILKKFNLDEETMGRIVLAVRDHRKKSEWVSPLHQSVFLADKILEQMGAYVIFRRAYYVGECTDYKDVPYMEAFISHFNYRLKKFSLQDFPARFRRLVEYQLKWIKDFTRVLEGGDKWAVDLSKKAYDQARAGKKNLDDFIMNYAPQNIQGEKIRQEAVKYIEGNKFREFEKLV